MTEGDGSKFLLYNCLGEGFDPVLPTCPFSLSRADPEPLRSVNRCLDAEERVVNLMNLTLLPPSLKRSIAYLWLVT